MDQASKSYGFATKHTGFLFADLLKRTHQFWVHCHHNLYPARACFLRCKSESKPTPTRLNTIPASIIGWQ